MNTTSKMVTMRERNGTIRRVQVTELSGRLSTISGVLTGNIAPEPLRSDIDGRALLFRRDDGCTFLLCGTNQTLTDLVEVQVVDNVTELLD
jgi:hypothetical protein